MRVRKSFFLLMILGSIISSASTLQNPQVLIETDIGDIVIEIYQDKAPVTAGNFLRYVDSGLFDGGMFYRVVTLDNQPNDDIKIEVIQGGLGYRTQLKRFDPIEHETTDQSGIRHQGGVISMARSRPGTASSEFFICVSDQPELDFGGRRNPDGQGFAAFGRVLAGMAVVHRIHRRPSQKQMLERPVKILSIRRIAHSWREASMSRKEIFIPGTAGTNGFRVGRRAPG